MVWKDFTIKKILNDFKYPINTICEGKMCSQNIAILSFNERLIKFYDLIYSCTESIATIENISGSGLKNNMLKLNENLLAVAGSFFYIIDLNFYHVVNRIYCVYAIDSISNFHFNEQGYFFVSQALTHLCNNGFEKGILSYYHYNFNDQFFHEKNTLVKLASKIKCHHSFITSIKQIDS